MSKVNNENPRGKSVTYSDVFIADVEHIQHMNLVFSIVTRFILVMCLLASITAVCFISYRINSLWWMCGSPLPFYRDVLRQNERSCTVWTPKQGLGKKKSIINAFLLFLII